MNYIGLSCGFHDASVCVLDTTGKMIYYAQSSQYSNIKADKDLHPVQLLEAKKYLTNSYEIHYYEKPVLKYLRQLRSGEQAKWQSVFASNMIGKDNHLILDNKPIHTHLHHQSHAAAGFQTSSYDRATVVVIDAIGEFDTVTIWAAEYISEVASYKLLWRQRYPDSIGLFYSAMTDAIGLQSLRDEYQLMRLSEQGDRSTGCHDLLMSEIINNVNDCTFKHNLHVGIPPEVLLELLLHSDADIAASTQAITEQLINAVMIRAAGYNFSDNLVYTGGVALNSIANQNLQNFFSSHYIPRYPGDSGSSIGAAALGLGRRVYL